MAEIKRGQIQTILDGLAAKEKTASAEFLDALRTPVMQEAVVVEEVETEKVAEAEEVETEKVAEAEEVETEAEPLEKDAELEKIAEAEDMGKIMAHSFFEELMKIAEAFEDTNEVNTDESVPDPIVFDIINKVKNNLNN